MTAKKRNIRRPQQFEESRMEGYFMISKRDAIVAVVNKLSGSQCRLWLYLMVVDPFADYTQGGEIKYHDLPSIAEIAIAIGSSPDTVDKDLRKLRKLGLYEYRTVTVQGHNLAAARAKAEAERLSKAKSKTISEPKQDKGSAYLSGDSAYLSGGEDYLSGGEDYLSGDGAYLSPPRKLKSLSDKASGAPQTIQTYSDFLQTLSEAERETFLEFGRKKAANLPHPPELPDKWITANFTELHKQFLSSSAGREAKQEAIARKYDWENDPRLMDWLHSAYYVGYPWTQEEETEREARSAFFFWAQQTNAYAGRISDELA